MAGLITGEAVELDLRPARLPSRMLAFIVDVLIQFVLLLLLVWTVSQWLPLGDGALTAAAMIVVVVAAFIGWPVTWETVGGGRTPGKLLMGLRVVRDDGGPVRFRHALVRGLVGVFADFWLTMGVGALVSSLVSQRGKRIGDIAAGTFVLRERTPGNDATLGMAYAALPPPVAAWASTLDLSSYPDDLALATRQYLGRISALDPAVAEAVGRRLANDTAACLQVPVPPGAHPTTFLMAVLTERQRRAYGNVRRAAGHLPPPVGPPGPAAPPGTAPPGPAAPGGPAGPPAPFPPPVNPVKPPQPPPAPPATSPPAPPQAPPQPQPQPPEEPPSSGGGFTPPA